MNSQELYKQLVGIHNREMGTGITLEPSSGNTLFPEADTDEQIIYFSAKLEHMFFLFDLLLIDKLAGSRAIHHFLLYHLALERNMYPKAEELLLQLKSDVEGLRPSVAENEAYRMIVSLQSCFALGHEMSHIYYAHHQDIWNNHIASKRHQVISYKEQFNKDKPFLIKLLHFFSKHIKNLQEQCYDEAIGSDALLEELCCDESAWHLMGSLIREMKLDAEITAEVCAHVGLTLAFLCSKRTLENIYLDPGKDIRERDLRFDVSRHTLQNKIVWDYMDDFGKEASQQFQSLINDYKRRGEVILMSTWKKEMEHIAYLRYAPKGAYSLKGAKRLETIYRSIWN